MGREYDGMPALALRLMRHHDKGRLDGGLYGNRLEFLNHLIGKQAAFCRPALRKIGTGLGGALGLRHGAL